MAKTVEDLRKFFGEERFNRIQEGMKVLGVEFLDSFEVYDSCMGNCLGRSIGDAPLAANHNCNYCVVFKKPNKSFEWANQDMIDKLGYFEFNIAYQKVGFIRDGIYYEWQIIGHEMEDFSLRKEHSKNFNEALTAKFDYDDRGLVSSTIRTEGKYKFPTISSTIDTVKADDNEVNFHMSLPIDDYGTLFRLIISSGRFDYKIPEGLNKPEALRTMAAIFDGRINKLIGDLKLEDQSWRFEKERKAINDTLDRGKKSARELRDKEISKIRETFTGTVENLESLAEQSLAELKRTEENYKSQRRLTQDK